MPLAFSGEKNHKIAKKETSAKKLASPVNQR
jgi:hypothetical protein